MAESEHVAPITMYRLQKHEKEPEQPGKWSLPTCVQCHMSFPCDTHMALLEVSVLQAEVERFQARVAAQAEVIQAARALVGSVIKCDTLLFDTATGNIATAEYAALRESLARLDAADVSDQPAQQRQVSANAENDVAATEPVQRGIR